MEHLETQVSDLRSFLPGGAPVPVPVGAHSSAAAAAAAAAAGSSAVPIGMAGGSMGIGPGAALSSTPRHPSQSAGSPVSAVGSNSAHPSPLPYNPNLDAAQPSRSFNPPSLSGGPTASPGSAVSGTKRKQDGGMDDASLKQQRSKRNRVSLLLDFLSSFRVLLEAFATWSSCDVGANPLLKLNSTSRSLGKSLPCPALLSYTPHTSSALTQPIVINRGWALPTRSSPHP